MIWCLCSCLRLLSGPWSRNGGPEGTKHTNLSEHANVVFCEVFEKFWTFWASGPPELMNTQTHLHTPTLWHSDVLAAEQHPAWPAPHSFITRHPHSSTCALRHTVYKPHLFVTRQLLVFDTMIFHQAIFLSPWWICRQFKAVTHDGESSLHRCPPTGMQIVFLKCNRKH